MSADHGAKLPKPGMAATASGPPQSFQVRQSRWMSILPALPILLFFGCFFAAWFIFLGPEPGPDAHAYVRISGHRRIVSPETTRLVALIVGGLIVAGFFALLVSRIRSGNKAITFRRGMLTVTTGGRPRILPFDQLKAVRISRLAIGTRVRLSSDTPPILLSLGDAHRLMTLLEAHGVTCRTNSDFPPRPTPAGATSDDTLWAGRPGWRSFTRTRCLTAAVLVPLSLLLIVWLWRIWTGPASFGTTGSDALGLRFFWTLIPLMILGMPLAGIITPLLVTHNEWLRDLTGIITIDRDGITWRPSPGGNAYREIRAQDILSVGLVEEDGERGWIGLSVRDHRGQVRELDLVGLPRPHEALAAIEAVIGARPA